MPTLQIQHPITDFDVWAKAFQRFADGRNQGGVRAQRVQRPVDDPNYVVIDIDFDSTDQAVGFRRFLGTQVGGNQEKAPALAGTPQTMILEPVSME